MNLYEPICGIAYELFIIKWNLTNLTNLTAIKCLI